MNQEHDILSVVQLESVRTLSWRQIPYFTGVMPYCADGLFIWTRSFNLFPSSRILVIYRDQWACCKKEAV